jgi:hypothetical protein
MDNSTRLALERLCSKCGEWVWLSCFPFTNTSYKLKDGTVVFKSYRLSYCADCLRRQKRDLEERRSKRRRHRTAAQRRRNNALPSSRAARRRYRHRLRAYGTVTIPTAVVKPFLDRMVALAGSRRALAAIIGVPERTLYAISHEERKGIRQATVDRLSVHGEFTLQEVLDRAKEWALLTGDPWPHGYEGSRIRKRYRKVGMSRSG